MNTERDLWEQAIGIWLGGGWAMVAIAVIAVLMFGIGIDVYLRIRTTGFRSVQERTWRRWITQAELREGPIGRLLDLVSGGRDLDTIRHGFERLRATELGRFERDLRVMKVCVGTAPLVGLLGTVTGMLATFSALSSGSGGEQTMAMIAAGISEALITTETGLVVALPGLFLQYQLRRDVERYKAFLAHVETVWTQEHWRRARAPDRRAVRLLAAARVRELLRCRVLERAGA